MKKYTLFNIESKVTLCICDTKEDAEKLVEIFGSKHGRTCIEEIEYLNSNTIKTIIRLTKEREQ